MVTVANSSSGDPEAGDKLLHAITSIGSVTGGQLARIFQVVAPADLVDESPAAVRYRRRRMLEALASLGHCESSWSADGQSVCAAPPALARLPIAGFATAVLVGARQPSTRRTMEDACRGICEIRTARNNGFGVPTPINLTVSAANETHLESVAASVGISYRSHPPAWDLCDMSASYEEISAQLDWVETESLPWESEAFDLLRLRFGVDSARAERATQLIRYRRPLPPHDFVFRLEREGAWSTVDPGWGRYLLLQEHRRFVLKFDQRRGCLSVPRGVPLPQLLDRAVCLCGGQLPKLSKCRQEWVYGGVPADLAISVALKLGQVLS